MPRRPPTGFRRLLILDAEVELVSKRGRRRLPLGEFIVGNRRTALQRDEIMTAIFARRPAPTARSSFLKLGARRYLVISIVMVAVLLDIVDEKVRKRARGGGRMLGRGKATARG